MQVLLWRAWCPFYQYPAVFSSLANRSIGGTCSQLLWHARALIRLGHSVQVLGASTENLIEEGVDFVASDNRESQELALSSGRIKKPDVILLEGGIAAAPLFRRHFPCAKVVHVGQNIDGLGHVNAFALAAFIDIYAMVSPGQFADYTVRFPKLRPKFMLVRNSVPWDDYHPLAVTPTVEDRIAWVGAWTKKGFVRWAETMEGVLQDYPSLQWDIYGPSHGAHVSAMPPAQMFRGLQLPSNRVAIHSLPMRPLIERLRRTRIVVVSLGNETACISALDAHAAGRPVLSGNDVVFKYVNPEGTGLRVTSARERRAALDLLLNDHGLCDLLGAAGTDLVRRTFSNKQQQEDLEDLLAYCRVQDRTKPLCDFAPPSRMRERFTDMSDRIGRRIPMWRVVKRSLFTRHVYSKDGIMT